jgi:hypothetical protein
MSRVNGNSIIATIAIGGQRIKSASVLHETMVSRVIAEYVGLA